MIKQQIEADLKTALLGGDKDIVSTLRVLKSAILYAEVSSNQRETGLSDAEVTAVLTKEAKKREESAVLYENAGEAARAAVERAERAIIEKYLPQALTETEVRELITATIAEVGAATAQDMGKVMAGLKPKIAGRADGALVAQLVKEQLQ